MRACTIIARNYLAHARVLAASYAAHHAGRRLDVLVVDGDAGGFEPATEPFATHLPSELPIAPDEFQRMAAIYDVTELSTAVKPFFLRLLLDQGSNAVLYLDPDIEVFAPLDDLGSLALEHGAVVIPHTLAPIPSDGKRPTMRDITQAGVFNLGFIGVGPTLRPFLDWWGEQLRRHCLMAVDEGLHVDQRFVDFLPAFHDPYIARDPSLNVAYWNLHERHVRWTGERYEVEGRPLRFFHFSGFDVSKAHVLSKHTGDRPRIVLDEEPDLARLCASYVDSLLRAGYRDAMRLTYGFSRTRTGVPLDRRHRRLYREALLAAEREKRARSPGALDPRQSETFLTSLTSPEGLTALPPRTRASYLLEEDPELGSPNPLIRLVQRVLLRALRPLLVHERRVQSALLQSIEETSSTRLQE